MKTNIENLYLKSKIFVDDDEDDDDEEFDDD